MDTHLHALSRAGLPVVITNVASDFHRSDGIGIVSVDYAEAARQGAGFLLERGFLRILLACGGKTYLGQHQPDWRRGYRQALRDCGRKNDLKLEINNFKAFANLARQAPAADACLLWDDFTPYFFENWPRHVAGGAAGNIYALAQESSCTITHQDDLDALVNIPYRQMGEQAIAMLAQMMEAGPMAAAEIRLPTSITQLQRDTAPRNQRKLKELNE